MIGRSWKTLSSGRIDSIFFPTVWWVECYFVALIWLCYIPCVYFIFHILLAVYRFSFISLLLVFPVNTFSLLLVLLYSLCLLTYTFPSTILSLGYQVVRTAWEFNLWNQWSFSNTSLTARKLLMGPAQKNALMSVLAFFLCAKILIIYLK